MAMASSPRTGPARRRWRFAWSMRSRPMSGRCRSARSLPTFHPRRRRSTFPPSRASAAACSISSIATAPRARPMTSSSNGWARKIRGPRVRGCIYIDHLTHNVHRGRMDVWTGFYEKLFNFRQIRFFDIEGRASGLFSRALTSPDGKIRIPINEDAGNSGQIEEYLNIYRGEGIQHIACGARDIFATVETLREAGLPFMPSPPDYLFREDRRAAAPAWRGRRPPAARRHSHRRRGRGRWRPHQSAAADLFGERDRADLLRIHPAQGRRRVRRGQLQGAVRIDRGRSDSQRRVEGGQCGVGTVVVLRCALLRASKA